ncbi:hypothetical protein RI129_002940 [Pyrocoelia pectoralis]|uniref:PHD-type domain-containing protein n=1 Tax=Pyrocoelia pectoralis TaxID=417401 RepID=A0AAN7VP31_9COLE
MGEPHNKENIVISQKSLQLQGTLSTDSEHIKKSHNLFERHLHYPEPIKKSYSRQKEKLPSAISSAEWRSYYTKKEEDKNRKLEEAKIKKEKRLKVKNYKEVEKLKKTGQKSKPKKVIGKRNQENQDPSLSTRDNKLKCSACNEDLISDVEEDDEKNIGCDDCPRWYHMKCTEFYGLTYEEASTKDYICFICS